MHLDTQNQWLGWQVPTFVEKLGKEQVKMAKELIAKADNPSSIPGPLWWEEVTDSCKFSSNFHTDTTACIPTPPK